MAAHRLFGPDRVFRVGAAFDPVDAPGDVVPLRWPPGAVPGSVFCGVTERRFSDGDAAMWRTERAVDRTRQHTGLVTMPHVTGSHRSPAVVERLLDRYRRRGVTTLLALRGDTFGPGARPDDAFPHAADLVRFARRHHGDHLEIGVGIHAEGHPESRGCPAEWRHTREKLELSDFAVTQFLLTPEPYLRLRDRVARAGVGVPVVPGVLPAVDPFVLLLRAHDLGVTCPAALRAAARDRAGYAVAATRMMADLCHQLIREGAPGLYVFTMNEPAPTVRLLRSLAATMPPDG